MVSVNFNLTIIQNFMQKSKLIDVKFVLLTPALRKSNATAGDFVLLIVIDSQFIGKYFVL